MSRVWTVGDPEPDDHPNVVAGADAHLPGPFRYRWEPPCEDNSWTGGWWCEDGNCDLVDWEKVLDEEGVVTEDMSGGAA